MTFWILDDILLIAQESLTSVDILKLARLVRVARCRNPQLSFQHWCSGSCRKWIGSLSTLQSYSPFSWSPSFSSPTGLPVFGKLVAQLDELCISPSRYHKIRFLSLVPIMQSYLPNKPDLATPSSRISIFSLALLWLCL